MLYKRTQYLRGHVNLIDFTNSNKYVSVEHRRRKDP